MFIPERKKRVVSDEPSTLQPPPNAPAWAVQSVVETGTIVVITCVLQKILHLSHSLLLLQIFQVRQMVQAKLNRTLMLILLILVATVYYYVCNVMTL